MKQKKNEKNDKIDRCNSYRNGSLDCLQRSCFSKLALRNLRRKNRPLRPQLRLLIGNHTYHLNFLAFRHVYVRNFSLRIPDIYLTWLKVELISAGVSVFVMDDSDGGLGLRHVERRKLSVFGYLKL